MMVFMSDMVALLAKMERGLKRGQASEPGLCYVVWRWNEKYSDRRVLSLAIFVSLFVREPEAEQSPQR